MTLENNLLNMLTAEMATWLEDLDGERILTMISNWDDATWQAAKRVAIMQGIGPYLGLTLLNTPIFPATPSWFQEWLQNSYVRNGERISRFQDDLRTILQAANRADIPVLLLKGSFLTTSIYQIPAIRPMADLDVLIHSKDSLRFGQLLVEHGYRHVEPKGRWPEHKLYVNTACNKVIMADEHPDNPRPIEVHTHLAQKFWGNFRMPDLTDMLWQTSQFAQVLGADVYIPAPEQHLVFLALHHLKHLFKGTGRLIQWLDIAYMMDIISVETTLPFLDMIYPVLRFSARVFPSHFAEVDWIQISQDVSSHMQRMCEQIPLDRHCGLQITPDKGSPGRWQLRWQNWHPNQVRLTLTFKDTPLVWAYLRYGLAFFYHSIRAMHH